MADTSALPDGGFVKGESGTLPWAEPETEGEWYIPASPAIHARNIALLAAADIKLAARESAALIRARIDNDEE
jgi:outer membrane protein assembly factor BamB